MSSSSDRVSSFCSFLSIFEDKSQHQFSIRQQTWKQMTKQRSTEILHDYSTINLFKSNIRLCFLDLGHQRKTKRIDSKTDWTSVLSSLFGIPLVVRRLSVGVVRRLRCSRPKFELSSTKEIRLFNLQLLSLSQLLGQSLRQSIEINLIVTLRSNISITSMKINKRLRVHR